MAKAFPLAWPEGWARTEFHDRADHLGAISQFQAMDAALDRLEKQLDLLGAASVVVSTNQQLRRDGRPYSIRGRLPDPGCAVYFMLDGRALAMAQDAYAELADNIRSLALSIEGLRQMNRHGGAHMMERAFRGFEALPPPADEQLTHKHEWWHILGIAEGSTLEQARTAYRRMRTKAHPDHGGNDEWSAAVNVAWVEAQAALA